MKSSMVQWYGYLILQKLMIPTAYVYALGFGVDEILSTFCIRGSSITSQHDMQFHCARTSLQATSCELWHLTRLRACSTANAQELPLDTRGLTLLTPEASCRYLGVMVGQLDTIDENWTKCI